MVVLGWALSHTVAKYYVVNLQSALNIPCTFGAHGFPYPKPQIDASSERFEIAPQTRAGV